MRAEGGFAGALPRSREAGSGAGAERTRQPTASLSRASLPGQSAALLGRGDFGSSAAISARERPRRTGQWQRHRGGRRTGSCGSTCARQGGRWHRLSARGGDFALCPVRRGQRGRHLPSPRLSAARRGHFEDGTRPGRAGLRGVRVRVRRGVGTVRQGRASPRVTRRGVSFSRLSPGLDVVFRSLGGEPWCGDHPRTGHLSGRGPCTARRLLPSPAGNRQSFRASFPSTSVCSPGVVSDFPGRGQ